MCVCGGGGGGGGVELDQPLSVQCIVLGANSDSMAFILPCTIIILPLQIEATVKVAKEKLLSQIEICQDQERQRSSSSQTQDRKSSSHQRSGSDADPAMVGVRDCLSLANHHPNKTYSS